MRKKAELDKTIAEVVGMEAAVALINRTTVSWHGELHRRAKASRYLFRGSGVLVLLLSASLPVLAASAYYSNRLAIAGLGSAIGTVSALNTFYRWGDRWRIYRRAELELEAALREWETDIIQNSVNHEPGTTERNNCMLATTQKLVTRTKAIIENQHLAFFEALQLVLPKVSAPVNQHVEAKSP